MPRHGENIYKRRDGRYEGQYAVGKTAAGKTKFGYIYGRQYTEVRNKLLQKKAERLQVMGSTVCCRMPLRDWLRYWLESELRGSVKASSYQTYLRQARVHLIPLLGSLGMSQITPPVICEFISRLEGEGLLTRGSTT